MGKNSKKTLKYLEKNNSISLKLFLISYCGIYNRTVLNGKISHDDIKKLMPNLKRVSFAYAFKNIREIYIGNIILVKDSYGHTAPYVKPNLMNVDYDKVINFEYDITCEKKDKFETAIELQNLKDYQLIELKNKYRQLGRITEYRKVCRLIRRNRNNGLKQYRIAKEKIKMKGRLEND